LPLHPSNLEAIQIHGESSDLQYNVTDYGRAAPRRKRHKHFSSVAHQDCNLQCAKQLVRLDFRRTQSMMLFPWHTESPHVWLHCLELWNSLLVRSFLRFIILRKEHLRHQVFTLPVEYKQCDFHNSSMELYTL